MTKRLVRGSLILTTLLLGGTLPARAASIVATAPQYQVSPNLNQCFISNPGDKPVFVPRLELMNAIGGVSDSASNFTIAPGAVISIDISGGGLTYCRAVGVSAKKIRLSHCVRPNSASPCTSITVGQ